jgi:excisionase family DNA binding protein
MQNQIRKFESDEEQISSENSGWLAKEVLSFKETLAFLDISSSTLYKLTHKRAISFYKPGGKLIYFKKADLMNWILQNRQPSNEEIKNQVFNSLNIECHG